MRDRNSEGCAFGRSALNRDLSPMVLHDLLHDGEPKSRPIFFALTYERFKDGIADARGNSAPVVTNSNVDLRTCIREFDLDLSRSARHGLARIQNEVEEDALELSMIEPALRRAGLANLDGRVVKFGIASHRMNRVFYGGADASVGWTQGCARARELQQGIRELCHALHGKLNFLIQFVALFASKVRLAQELRVGHHGGHRMPQVMRD